MPHMASHKNAERLAFLNRSLTEVPVWEGSVREAFPKLDRNPKAERRRKPRETPFLRECRQALRKFPRSSDLSQPRKALYRELVVGAECDPIRMRNDLSEEEYLPLWNWAPGTDYLTNGEFSLTWRLIRNALHLNDVGYKAGIVDMPDCPRCDSGLEETVQHAFFHCRKVRPLWNYVNEVTARLDSEQHRLDLDAGFVVDNTMPPWTGLKRTVFQALMAVARMVVWTTRCTEIFENKSFSSYDLIRCFQHQLKVKIRCDRKRLYRKDFCRRWVRAVSLVCLSGARREWTFPPLQPD